MAYSYEIPLSNTINVSLTTAPTGLAGFNVNSIALFTNEPVGFSESYRSYISADSVEKDCGSDSLTFKMAQQLFIPVPNFRTGNGILYIFPYNAVNATSASLTTGDISSNINNFKTVTNGSLNLNIDGVQTLITNLDFSNIKTLEDIVNVIQNENPDIYILSTKNTITFQSKRFGEESSIAMSSSSAKGAVDLFEADYFNGANATTTQGVNSSGQTLAQAVQSAQQQIYFGGVLSTQFCENALILANTTAIQALDCTYFNEITSLKNISILGADIQKAGLGKTRSLAYSNDAEGAKIATAAYATIVKSVNWNGENTANTMNLKTLTGVSPDRNLSTDYVLSAKTNGVDIYGSTGGISVVYSNDNNGYTDEIEADLWLKKKIEVDGFNYLRQTNTKIPQTEAAMNGLKDTYGQVCIQAIKNGSAAPGLWNGAIPFGDPEDFKRNIKERGYYIYSLPIAQQAQAEREKRKAPVVQIALKRSGAFHSSEIIINIQR